MTTRKKDKGFIALYRDILDHWIWTEKPFDRPRAWIDLLLTVNYADKEFMFNGKITTVKRGSIITSISKLSGRWEWSTTKVSNFLNLLEKQGMISQKRTSKNTVITIDNYAFWQDIEFEKNIRKTSEKEQKNNRAITEQKQKNNRKIQLNQVNQDKPSRTKINQVNKLDQNKVDVCFDEFWKAYPRKVGKGKARNSFVKINPSQKLYEKMMTALSMQKVSEQWTKDGGQFIPHPTTWLNQERWEDEPDNLGKQSETVHKDYSQEEDSLARARRIRAERAKANAN